MTHSTDVSYLSIKDTEMEQETTPRTTDTLPKGVFGGGDKIPSGSFHALSD